MSEASGSAPRVGVLAIQGDVEKHLAVLERLGARGRRVLGPADLAGLDGLVLPGGESTTIAKGLERSGLGASVRAFAERGGALLGTCAGAILLARASLDGRVPTLGLIDVVADRNAYGTQVDSFVAPADADAAPSLRGMECVFIRAPRLVEPGPGVEVLVRVEAAPVLVRQGRRWACTFHPELTSDGRVHEAWLADVAAVRSAAEPPTAMRVEPVTPPALERSRAG